MKIIILKWTHGENDPFSGHAKLLQDYLRNFGRCAEIIDLNDPEFYKKIDSFHANGIDFVISLQGVGTNFNIRIDEQEKNLWQALNIPVICTHADHPSHCPANHQLDNVNFRHLYMDESACYFSNKYFRKKTAASMITLPPLDTFDSEKKRDGKYFVFPKNVNHPNEFKQDWKDNLNPPLRDFLMSFISDLETNILSESGYFDFHENLDQAFIDNGAHSVFLPENFEGLNYFHSQVDMYARNYKSVFLLNSLKDFPVKIFGRGWDFAKKDKNPKHEFFDGLDSDKSRDLYFSEYGILDISPFKGFHDRSLRAIANRTSFFSNAIIDEIGFDTRDYSSLFYNFCLNDIEDKCASISRNPAAHNERSRSFSFEYGKSKRKQDFMDSLILHSESIRKSFS